MRMWLRVVALAAVPTIPAPLIGSLEVSSPPPVDSYASYSYDMDVEARLSVVRGTGYCSMPLGRAAKMCTPCMSLEDCPAYASGCHNEVSCGGPNLCGPESDYICPEADPPKSRYCFFQLPKKGENATHPPCSRTCEQDTDCPEGIRCWATAPCTRSQGVDYACGSTDVPKCHAAYYKAYERYGVVPIDILPSAAYGGVSVHVVSIISSMLFLMLIMSTLAWCLDRCCEFCARPPEEVSFVDASTTGYKEGDHGLVKVVRVEAFVPPNEDARPRQFAADVSGKRVLAVLIPAYNEEACEILQTLADIASQNGIDDFELRVLLVMDGRDALAETNIKTLDTLFGQQLELGDDIAQTTSYEWVDEEGEAIPTPRLTLRRPIKLSLIVKKKNMRKLNSHEWFLRAFCEDVGAEFAFLSDAGTRFGSLCLYHLVSCLDNRPEVNAVCGKQVVASRRQQLAIGDGELFDDSFQADWLRAVQAYEIEGVHIFSKPAYAMIGYLPVLPGPCGMYRYSTMQRSVVDSYFNFAEVASKLPILGGNVKIAEDRIPSHLSVFGPGSRGITSYEPRARFYYYGEGELYLLLLQRRRWLNGALCSLFLFGMLQQPRYSIWGAHHKHGLFFRVRVQVFMALQVLDTVFSLISPALYGVTTSAALLYLLRSYIDSRDLSPEIKFYSDVVEHPFARLVGPILHFILLIVFVVSHMPQRETEKHKVARHTCDGCLHGAKKDTYRPKVWYMVIIVNVGAQLVLFAALAVEFTRKYFQYFEMEGRSTILNWVRNEHFAFLMLAPLFFMLLPLVIALVFEKGQFEIMIQSFVPYWCFHPVYIGWFNAYAVARLNDVSWGTRGATSSVEEIGKEKGAAGMAKKNEARAAIYLEKWGQFWVGIYLLANGAIYFFFGIAISQAQHVVGFRESILFIGTLVWLPALPQIFLGFMFQLSTTCMRLTPLDRMPDFKDHEPMGSKSKAERKALAKAKKAAEAKKKAMRQPRGISKAMAGKNKHHSIIAVEDDEDDESEADYYANGQRAKPSRVAGLADLENGALPHDPDEEDDIRLLRERLNSRGVVATDQRSAVSHASRSQASGHSAASSVTSTTLHRPKAPDPSRQRVPEMSDLSIEGRKARIRERAMKRMERSMWKAGEEDALDQSEVGSARSDYVGTAAGERNQPVMSGIGEPKRPSTTIGIGEESEKKSGLFNFGSNKKASRRPAEV